MTDITTAAVIAAIPPTLTSIAVLISVLRHNGRISQAIKGHEEREFARNDAIAIILRELTQSGRKRDADKSE